MFYSIKLVTKNDYNFNDFDSHIKIPTDKYQVQSFLSNVLNQFDSLHFWKTYLPISTRLFYVSHKIFSLSSGFWKEKFKLFYIFPWIKTNILTQIAFLCWNLIEFFINKIWLVLSLNFWFPSCFFTKFTYQFSNDYKLKNQTK